MSSRGWEVQIGGTCCWWSRLCQRAAFSELSRRMKEEGRWKGGGGELPAGHNNSSDPSLCLSTHCSLSQDSCKEPTSVLSLNRPHLWQMLLNEMLKTEPTCLMQGKAYWLHMTELSSLCYLDTYRIFNIWKQTTFTVWLMGKREKVLIKTDTYWGQDLGLGDDAIGETILPALSSNLRPGDLEARDSLTGGQSGHTPQEVPSDISLINWERSRQVLWFSQNLWNTWNCWKNNGICHVHHIGRMTFLVSN